MRLVSFKLENRSAVGVVTDDGVIALSRHDESLGRSLKHILRSGALGRVEELTAGQPADFALTDIDLLPPVINPNKILCVGINYRPHVLETGRELPSHPWIFVRFADSFVGHGGAIVRPSVSDKLDFEGELAVVIGRDAHRVKAQDAFEYVAGYTCLNDASIRDFQRHSPQFTPGKNFLNTGSAGPWLVTADEIGDVEDLSLETRLNGEVMQSASTGDLIFDIPALIEYCSTFTRLEAGDVIATGTPGGVGFARKPPVWMKPGDTIEVSISGIGVLANTIADE